MYSYLKLFVTTLLVFATAGCATAPKPKTVGDVVGSAVDTSISWASAGIQKLMNK